MRKRLLSLLILTIYIVLPMGIAVNADSDVVVSSQEYTVYYTAGSSDNFLCNKKSVGSQPGTEYYLTYTVSSCQSVGIQGGIAGTDAPTESYPYAKDHGMLFYNLGEKGSDKNDILLPGYTYFIKFTALESGFRYTAARAKGDNSEYLVFDSRAVSEKSVHCGYYGIWLAVGNTVATLSNVHFYDKNGNDLGVWSPKHRATVTTGSSLQKDSSIPRWYTIKASGMSNLALSNKTPLTTKKMYMEYTVRSTKSEIDQSGVAYSNDPLAGYPHGNGMIRYEGKSETANTTGDMLLKPGASYIIEIERFDDDFTAIVQMTLNGKTTRSVFPSLYGTCNPESQFFSLWFGEGHQTNVDFTLENVKFYDENHNDLEVQSNDPTVMFRRLGALVDYDGCEAMYYCKNNDAFYLLYKDSTYKYSSDDDQSEGTYSVASGKISFSGRGQSDYLFKSIKEENGDVYNRLYTYTVSFVPEEKIQTLSLKNGYYAKKPGDPSRKDCKFVEWCTLDGKAFNFNGIVTESTQLYAKWKDKNGNEFLETLSIEANQPVDLMKYLIVAICVVLICSAVAGGFFILKGGKKK